MAVTCERNVTVRNGVVKFFTHCAIEIRSLLIFIALLVII